MPKRVRHINYDPLCNICLSRKYLVSHCNPTHVYYKHYKPTHPKKREKKAKAVVNNITTTKQEYLTGPLDRLELSWLGKLNITEIVNWLGCFVNTRLTGKLSLAGEKWLVCFFSWVLDSKNKLWSDYEQSPFPLRDSRSKRTHERARKSPAAWKRDARVNSRQQASERETGREGPVDSYMLTSAVIF